MFSALPLLWRPTILSLVLAVTACGGAARAPNTAADASGEAANGPGVGKPAPDLSIHTLNGKGDISLTSLAGKTVIVDFWATWCGPCKQSFPRLQQLQQTFGDRAVVVGVSVDDEDSGILDFVKETGATFPIGWDKGHELAGRWKVSTMPTTFIVDGSGVVRFVHAGFHDGEAEQIAKEMAELSTSPSARVAGPDAPRPKVVASTAVASTAVASAAVEPVAETEKDAPAPSPKKKTAKHGKGTKKHSKKKKA